ncbi:MAG: DUF5711 family protein [Eubacteriales bacterium]|nr:DUF5711 family protein [Eubacteriales bacterium]
MADFFGALTKRRKRRKKIKKAKIAKAQAGMTDEEKLLYRSRLRRKTMIQTILLILIFIVAAALGISFIQERRTYKNYKVESRSRQEDIVSTGYKEFNGKILRYSQTEVALVDTRMETLWNATYTMTNPIADVCGDYAVIADQDGTVMEIYNSSGFLGEVTTSYAIVKVTIGSNGLVAAILNGGDDTWINFYGTDGSLIAENQTRIDDPGYPMDVAISNNGQIMMVTYQYVDGNKTTSYVAFYNFGEVGQSEDDRIVSGYTYEGLVIPEVQYLKEDRCIAIREDGVILYGGAQIPEEIATIPVEQEIVSTFYDEEMIGLVFKNEEGKNLYRMDVYNTDGVLKFSKEFNIPYTQIKVSGGNILMYNSSQIGVVNNRGITKFSGTIDGTIEDFFKLGSNRYLLVLDNGVNVIRLS